MSTANQCHDSRMNTDGDEKSELEGAKEFSEQGEKVQMKSMKETVRPFMKNRAKYLK